MRFLVDNSVSPRLAQWLAERGHVAERVRARGMRDASDQDILAVAEHEGSVIVAMDSDFATLLAVRRSSFPSVMLFRRREKTVASQIMVLSAHLGEVSEDLAAGAVVVFDDARIRIRRLPLIPVEQNPPNSGRGGFSQG